MNVFDPVIQAYGDGLRDLQDTFKIERDRNIQVYNKLKPQDFQAISDKYGPEAVTDYIQRMESRRMKRR
jgi:hypothetical protein